MILRNEINSLYELKIYLNLPRNTFMINAANIIEYISFYTCSNYILVNDLTTTNILIWKIQYTFCETLYLKTVKTDKRINISKSNSFLTSILDILKLTPKYFIINAANRIEFVLFRIIDIPFYICFNQIS